MKNITSKFHVHPSRSRNHSLYLFPEFSLFFLAFLRVERRDISFNNWNFFRGSKMDRFLFLESMESRWDPTGMERYDRERLRVLIEFPTLPDSNSTFISRFARESDPAEVRVSLISRLPPVEQQSISYRDRVIEKREDSCCHSPVPKLNSRSRRFISSRAPACRQLQLPNFIFHVFGHRETRVVKSTR